jgi:hypothetical protein
LNIGYAPSTSTYKYWRKQIAGENPEALRWLDNIRKEKWTQAYDGGCRWGHMTSNLAESMNSVFKNIRNQPITSLVQQTFYKCAELFGRRAKQAAAVVNSRQGYSEACQKRIVDALEKANTHIVTEFDRQRLTSSVKETEDPHEGRPIDHFALDLVQKSCNCGKFQALHLPCSHAIAACSKGRIPYQDYIHHVYTAASVYNVYENPFPVIPSKSLWPTYEGDRVVARSSLKRTEKGRPKKNRIRTEMDDFGKREWSCGLCNMPGHNSSNCPNAGGPSASH